MPDHLGDDMRKTKVDENKEEKEIKGMFVLLLCHVKQTIAHS